MLSPDIYSGEGRNLIDIYQIARESDAVYRQAYLDARIDTQQADINSAGVLPQISLNADRSKLYLSGDTDADLHSYSLSLTQTVFDHAGFSSVGQADVIRLRANAQRSRIEVDLLYRVGVSYFGVLQAKDELELASSVRDNMQQQLDQVKLRFEADLIPITDVLETQEDYDLSVDAEILAAGQLNVAAEGLAILTGSEQQLKPLLPNVDLKPLSPRVLPYWTDLTLANSTELAVSELTVEERRFDIAIERSDFLPKLTLNLSRNYEKDTSQAIQGAYNTRLGLNLTMSLFSGGREHAEFQQAKTAYQSISVAHELVQRQVLERTSNSYDGVEKAIERYRTFRDALDSSRTALAAIESGFRVGIRSKSDVLVAAANLLEIERSLLQARYSYLNSLLDLKAATGTLSEQTLYDLNYQHVEDIKSLAWQRVPSR